MLLSSTENEAASQKEKVTGVIPTSSQCTIKGHYEQIFTNKLSTIFQLSCFFVEALLPTSVQVSLIKLYCQIIMLICCYVICNIVKLCCQSNILFINRVNIHIIHLINAKVVMEHGTTQLVTDNAKRRKPLCI